MPENPSQATQWAATIAALLVAAGGLLTAWFSRRSTVDTTRETGRQFDLNTLIDTMQEERKTDREEMANMRAELREVKAENRECLADRDQMRAELRRVKARLGELEQATGGG